MLISLSGAALIITKGHATVGTGLAPGDLLALLAMLGWAGYTLLQKSRRRWSELSGADRLVRGGGRAVLAAFRAP